MKQVVLILLTVMTLATGGAQANNVYCQNFVDTFKDIKSGSRDGAIVANDRDTYFPGKYGSFDVVANKLYSTDKDKAYQLSKNGSYATMINSVADYIGRNNNPAQLAVLQELVNGILIKLKNGTYTVVSPAVWLHT
ncbi:MAG: hypothetical protein AB7E76_13940 [Deferribacterales bacterium]